MLRHMDPNESAYFAVRPSDLARALRCRRELVYAAIRGGELRAIRLGNGWRILPKDVEAWLDKLRSQ